MRTNKLRKADEVLGREVQDLKSHQLRRQLCQILIKTKLKDKVFKKRLKEIKRLKRFKILKLNKK